MRSREEVLREFEVPAVNGWGEPRAILNTNAMADRIRELEAEVARYVDIFQSVEGTVPRGEVVAWALVRDGRVVDLDNRYDGSGLRFIALNGDTVCPLVFGDSATTPDAQGVERG